MDSYHKVVVPQKREQENEIFVNSKSPASHLLSRVMALFKEKSFREVTFRATGGAISTAVTVAELTKRRIEGLHQITTIGTTDVSSVFEPTIEGLDKHEQTRLVSSIVIKLTLNAVDPKTSGYQAPLSATEFQAAQQASRAARGVRPPRTTGAPRRSNNGGPSSSSAPGTETQTTGTSSTSPSGENRGPRGPRAPRGGRGPRVGGSTGPRGPRAPRSDSPSGASPSADGNSSPNNNANRGPRGPRGPRRGGPNNRGPRTGSRPSTPGGDVATSSSPTPTAQ